MFLVQQLENTILVPRIMGQALDLHALVVIVGVYMGGSLAGILGAVLAAPVIASLKLLSIYAWRKMFDLYPFPHPEKIPPPKPSWRERGKSLMTKIQHLLKRR
jgi:predicted PurR-regulated permease PerM